jgi:hypothetical protein
MNRIVPFVFCALFLNGVSAVLTSADVGAEEVRQVFVEDFSGDGSRSLHAALASQFQVALMKSNPRTKALTKRDLQDILRREEYREILDCSDSSCVSEIIDNYGIAMTAIGRIDQIGPGDCVLTMKVFERNDPFWAETLMTQCKARALIEATQKLGRLLGEAGFEKNENIPIQELQGNSEMEARAREDVTILMKACQSRDWTTAAKYIAYTGSDETREYRDTLNPAIPEELKTVRDDCQSINGPIFRSTNYRFIGYKINIDNRKQLTWHLLTIRFEGERTKDQIFCLLLIKGRLAIGDID